MKILGVNDQHNASACVIEDGRVVAALQEERLTRIKNHFCFPHGAVRWLLEHTKTDPEELSQVALASRHIIGAFNAQDLLRSFDEMYGLRSRTRALAQQTPAMRIARWRRRRERLAEVATAGLPVERTTFVDHHTAHAAAAYHGSPWREGPVLVLTADGHGDGLSATVRLGRDGRLSSPLATVEARHSLGSLYATITALLGMVPLEHEYKLMGMAPYAPGKGAERSYAQFEDTLVFEDGGLTWRTGPGLPPMDRSYREFRDRLERHRFDWIAAGLQRFTEEHLVEWTRNAVATTGVDRVALGGGVFMNVKANQRIYQMEDVGELFVFPSCGDETNSMGAAWQAQANASDESPRSELGDVYWGPDISEEEAAAAVAPLEGRGYRVEHCRDDIEEAIASLLASGAIVARARGPMEFGARALGNRSILADPTAPDVVRIINDMIKARDFWMPFAPSIMAEEADTYLVNPRVMPAPYMIMTFDTTERSDEIAGAVHPYDRTARPQVVTREHNPDFHRLIAAFRERTGRGAVLNTSFNLHGYPIVATASDAVSVLEQSGLPHLAVGNYLVSKPGEPA